MAMPPAFDLGMLNSSDLHRRRQGNRDNANNAANSSPQADTSAPAVVVQQEVRATRSSKRPTSYYNAFQTTCAVSHDEPPTYALAARAPALPNLPSQSRDVLPSYSCSVGAEMKLLLNLESISPLHSSCEGEWREVYAIIRGTIISFHRVKDGGPGKLLRSYTLQHAEVGLAPDAQHTVLTPRTRLAHLIPSGARRRAWQKDAELFNSVKQTVLRLRVETDQILLADSSEERINQLIHTLGAAMDIAQPIDDRSIPRQCTVPRRRRRPRAQADGDLTDPILLAEQERIFRQMYPSFAGPRPELQRTVTEVSVSQGLPQSPSREEEEIDLSMIREETATAVRVSADPTTRPANVRQTTSTTINSTFTDDMMYSTPATNFDTNGKWQPPHVRPAAQVQRYIRRCMPILLADSPRASDVLITDGRRIKVNWRMELLEEWELQPPTYKAHNFSTETGLARTNSQRSASESATQVDPQSSTSVLGGEMEQILPAAAIGMENLQLSKITTQDKVTTPGVTQQGDNSFLKTRNTQQPLSSDMHGVVFCF